LFFCVPVCRQTCGRSGKHFNAVLSAVESGLYDGLTFDQACKHAGLVCISGLQPDHEGRGAEQQA